MPRWVGSITTTPVSIDLNSKDNIVGWFQIRKVFKEIQKGDVKPVESVINSIVMSVVIWFALLIGILTVEHLWYPDYIRSLQSRTFLTIVFFGTIEYAAYLIWLLKKISAMNASFSSGERIIREARWKYLMAFDQTELLHETTQELVLYNEIIDMMKNEELISIFNITITGSTFTPLWTGILALGGFILSELASLFK